MAAISKEAENRIARGSAGPAINIFWLGSAGVSAALMLRDTAAKLAPASLLFSSSSLQQSGSGL
jgi:hypothetical protein